MPINDVWPIPWAARNPRLWSVSSRLVIAAVSLCSKIWVGVFNEVRVNHAQRLQGAIAGRAAGRGLITVCNHHSMLDDNLLACICSWRTIMKTGDFRWVPGAKESMFTQYKTSLFFQLGRVVPVVRGDGVYQDCMNFCMDQLNAGKWVHMYPEGKVNMTKVTMRLKWGVGRLVADAEIAPIVLPYWHLGMEEIMPNTKPYIPHAGKKVTVLVGEPMDFEKTLTQLRRDDVGDEDLRKFITDRIQEEFARLNQVAEGLHGHHLQGTGRQGRGS